MLVRSAAKINWSLDVIGKRADKYHDLDGIMQSIRLYDSVYITKAETLTLDCAGTDCSGLNDSSNIAFCAAEAFFKAANVRRGAEIRIEKRIPLMAGLAGGSADAAAVIVGLDRLYGTDLGLARLREIGLTIGADVPFCITGGTARARGVGERLESLEIPAYDLVIAMPDAGLSTAQVFSLFDVGSSIHPDVDALENGLRSRDFPLIKKGIGNSLQAISVSLEPRINEIIQAMTGAGAVAAAMTGSGPAVFALCEDDLAANRVYDALDGFWRCKTTTTGRGIEIAETGEPWRRPLQTSASFLEDRK